MPLDPALDVVLKQLVASDAPKLHELSPEEARALFDASWVASTPIELASVEDRLIPGPDGDLPVRIYRPDVPGTQAALVYFHGGGWVIGSIDSHDAACRELADGARCTVVSVDYRLAPEHPYPAAAEDAHAALAWTADNAAALGIDRKRIAVAGDSAGGNLAAAVCLMARDRGGPDVCFQLLVYPIIDANFETASYRANREGFLLEREAMQWFWDLYVPDPSQRGEAYVAPLRADRVDGLPAALVITAEFDPLRDEGEAYARRMKEAGVAARHIRYDGMVHGFFAMGAVVPRAKAAMQETCDALREVLSAA